MGGLPSLPIPEVHMSVQVNAPRDGNGNGRSMVLAAVSGSEIIVNVDADEFRRLMLTHGLAGSLNAEDVEILESEGVNLAEFDVE
jgi:hypothetical protein